MDKVAQCKEYIYKVAEAHYDSRYWWRGRNGDKAPQTEHEKETEEYFLAHPDYLKQQGEAIHRDEMWKTKHPLAKPTAIAIGAGAPAAAGILTGLKTHSVKKGIAVGAASLIPAIIAGAAAGKGINDSRRKKIFGEDAVKELRQPPKYLNRMINDYWKTHDPEPETDEEINQKIRDNRNLP